MRTAPVILLLLLLGGHAYACSCVESSLRANFREAPCVFVAKLLSVKQSARVAVPRGVVVRVVVVESWKGVRLGQKFDIATGSGGGDCGYAFEDALANGDSTHLLFARPVPKRKSLLTTDLCTGSKPLRWASAARDSLNRWKALGVVAPAPGD